MAGAGTLHRDKRVQPADVGEEREACVLIAARGANGVDVGLRDERELRHAGETVTDAEEADTPASVEYR